MIIRPDDYDELLAENAALRARVARLRDALRATNVALEQTSEILVDYDCDEDDREGVRQMIDDNRATLKETR